MKSPSFQRAATLNGYKTENGANIPVIFTHIAARLRKLDVNFILFFLQTISLTHSPKRITRGKNSGVKIGI